MIRGGNDNELPYRSPVTAAAPAPQYSSDEADYNTLKNVRVLFADTINNLSKDFNAFDVLSEGTNQAKIETMMRNIAGKQIAYDILAPLLERLDSALMRADNNAKQRNNQ